MLSELSRSQGIGRMGLLSIPANICRKRGMFIYVSLYLRSHRQTLRKMGSYRETRVKNKIHDSRGRHSPGKLEKCPGSENPLNPLTRRVV